MDTMDGMLDMHALEVATETHASYVLSWQLGEVDDGEAECSVHVLMKREGGVLLALPGAFLPEWIVSAGNLGEEGAVFGPSFRTVVPAVLVEDGVVPITGDNVEVLVVDCLPEVLTHMRRHHVSEEIAFSYDEDAPFNVPSLDALMPAVRSWLEGVPDLAAFYTPEEEDLTPAARPKRQPGRRAMPTESGARPKRPTTAALAVEIQQLVEFMPKLSQQLADLSQRQDLVESRILPYQSASSVASQPLGKALDLQPPPPLGALAKAVGAPPRTATHQSLGLLASVSPPSKSVDVEGPGSGEAEPSRRAVPERRLLASPSGFGTVSSPYLPCGSDCSATWRPYGRVEWPYNRHKRGSRPCQASDRTGASSGNLFSNQSCSRWQDGWHQLPQQTWLHLLFFPAVSLGYVT